MTQNPVPQGRDQLKQAALDALQRAELDRREFDAHPRELAQYEALRAIAYAILGDGEPSVEDKLVATFGEPDVGRHRAADPAPPLPLFTVQWDYSEGPSHGKLQLVSHGDEENLDVVAASWTPEEDEINSDGMIRDVADLASWVASSIITSVAKGQDWSPGMVTSTLVRAGGLLAMNG